MTTDGIRMELLNALIELAWIPMEADWANICCRMIGKKPAILSFSPRNWLCSSKS